MRVWSCDGEGGKALQQPTQLAQQSRCPAGRDMGKPSSLLSPGMEAAVQPHFYSPLSCGTFKDN